MLLLYYLVKVEVVEVIIAIKTVARCGYIPLLLRLHRPYFLPLLPPQFRRRLTPACLLWYTPGMANNTKPPHAGLNQLHLRLSREMIEKIDDFIRLQPFPISRTDAIRIAIKRFIDSGAADRQL